MVSAFLISGVVIAAYVIVLFILAIILRDYSIVDIAWGPGFVLAAAGCLFQAGNRIHFLLLLLFLFLAAWGFRLGIHLFIRNRKRGEDPRYANWRKAWGKWHVPRAFFQVFLLQGGIMWIVLLPVTTVIENAFEATYIELFFMAGMVLFFLGFYIETVSDFQLLRFKRDPFNKGKVCRVGWWNRSRHPNYFGEMLLWWGFSLMALGIGAKPWVLVSPILLTFLLTRVSGVPMTEELLKNRPGYAEYQREVPAFIPRLGSGRD